MVPISETEAAEPVVVFSTDFEGIGIFISAWEPLGWSRGNYAEDHQDDQWCRANGDVYRSLSSVLGEPMSAYSSASALYSNKIGTNSIDFRKNVDNAYPDPGTDAWVRFAPPDADRYDGMTLTFWYWARTHAANHTGELTDYLCVNINNGTATTQAWKQPSPESGGWRLATVVMPRGTVWMEWEYKTSNETDGHYPGVFIDDVTVTTGRMLPGPPTSRVTGMSEHYNSRTVQVPVSMTDGDRMSLYYRPVGGEWTMYTDHTAPDGLFTRSPITFQAPSDGKYEVYSVASNATYTERKQPTAEATFTVDTIAPTLAITSPDRGSVLGSGKVTVAWSANDLGSGVLSSTVSVDGQAPVDAIGSYTFTGLAEGSHTAEVTVRDRANNIVRDSVTFLVNLTGPSMTVSPTGSDVPRSATASVTFHEEMDKASVVISVSGVEGSLSWSGDKVTFTPQLLLAYDTTYQVTVKGRDADGDAFTTQWSFTTVGEGGIVSGTIRDANGNPIANAVVELSNGLTATTNATGYFEFVGVPAGHYTMMVSKNGYVILKKDVKVTGLGEDIGSINVKGAQVAEDDYLPLVLICVIGLAGLIFVLLLGRKRR